VIILCLVHQLLFVLVFGRQPRVAENMVERNALRCIDGEALADERRAAQRDIAWSEIHARDNLPERLVVCVAMEGKAACNKREEDDAQRPDVYLRADVLAAVADLRRRVVQRAERVLELQSRVPVAAEAPISKLIVIGTLSIHFDAERGDTDLHCIVLVQKHVLALQVSMHDKLLMSVFDCCANLRKNNFRFGFGELLPFVQVVQEISATRILHNL
jgi:hypothetical protein